MLEKSVSGVTNTRIYDS